MKSTIVYITFIILITGSENAVAKFGDCDPYVDFIDNISLGMTLGEARKSFTTISPKPKKLTEHIYGALCVIDNETYLVGTFLFFSDKLAVSQVLVVKLNSKELINNTFDTAKKTNMFDDGNIEFKPRCPTVDLCIWQIETIGYSISISRAHQKANNDEISFFIASRRKDSLVSNSNITKSELDKESKDAMRKLILNLPSGHKLK